MKKRILAFLFMMLTLLLIPACNKSKSKIAISDEAKKICGSWAYNHDSATAIAIFNEDGSAQYDGKDYTFDSDGQFVTLTDSKNNSIKLRYEMTEAGMNLYRNNTYTFGGEGEPDSIIGLWEIKDKNWSFQFSKEGHFLEDGIFTGAYLDDKENGILTLDYGDHFEDSICYYKIEGNSLHLEYPWPMVITGTEDATEVH